MEVSQTSTWRFCVGNTDKETCLIFNCELFERRVS